MLLLPAPAGPHTYSGDGGAINQSHQVAAVLMEHIVRVPFGRERRRLRIAFYRGAGRSSAEHRSGVHLYFLKRCENIMLLTHKTILERGLKCLLVCVTNEHTEGDNYDSGDVYFSG